MPNITPKPDRAGFNRNTALVLAVLLQIGCTVVFLGDVLSEWRTTGAHAWPEAIAIVALILGAGLGLRELNRLLHRNANVERALDAAGGAFQSVIDQHFDDWGLTVAERDVALMSIKGLPLADIARLRETREGTIKAQNAAIYRKAGISNRAELISAVIEDLIAGLPLTPAKAPAEEPESVNAAG